MKVKYFKQISRLAAFMYIFMTIVNSIFAVPVYGQDPKVSPRLTQNLSINKSEIQSGESINIQLYYKDMYEVQAGQTIEINIPDSFESIKEENIKYPTEHFQNLKIENNKIILTFKDIKGELIELAGYITINAKAKNIESITQGKIESIFQGDTTSKDITIKPKENQTEKPTKDVLVSKSSNTGNGSTIIVGDENKNVIGRKVEYTIQINEKIVQNISFKLIDDIPEGMELLTESIDLYRIEGESSIKLSNEEVKAMMSYNLERRELVFDFKNISNQYTLKYSTEINENKDKYNNKVRVELESNEGIGENTILTSNVEISVKPRPVPEEAKPGNNGILKKSAINNANTGNQNTVTLGDKVNYKIFVNEPKNIVHNGKLTDNLPKGTSLVDNSIKIEKEIQTFDSINKPHWKNENVTSIFENGDISDGEIVYSEENNILEIIFPKKIVEKYIIRYEVSIDEVHREYKNEATLNFDVKTGDKFTPSSTTVSKTMFFDTSAGSIASTKYVDKKELKPDDNNKVNYTIYVESRGVFPNNYINISDKIYKDVKVENIKVEALDSMKNDISYKIEWEFDENENEITVINKEALENRDIINIIIETDFTDVEDGTTVQNIAKVNDANTNPVETKKGYSFEGKKVNLDDKLALKGAIFKLFDENENIIIDNIESDEEGVIKGTLEKIGKYKLIETKAPEGYIVDSREIEFEVKEEDIGTNIFIGNIENKKIPPIVDESEEDDLSKPEPPIVDESEVDDLSKPEPPIVDESEDDDLSKPEPPKVDEKEEGNLSKPEPPIVDESEVDDLSKPEPPKVDEKEEGNLSNNPKTGDIGLVLDLTVALGAIGLLVILKKKNSTL